MKRGYFIIGVFLFLYSALVSGCGYHLRYTVKSQSSGGSFETNLRGNFVVERRAAPGSREYYIESGLIDVVSRSLSDLGWKETRAQEADYIFQVEFREEESTPEIGFGAGFGSGSGFFFFGQLNTTRNEYTDQYIRIVAFENGGERVYFWSADVEISRVIQDMQTLASHTIPTALSHFPEQGYWKVKKKVRLNRKEK
jgi:hypothetical protein